MKSESQVVVNVVLVSSCKSLITGLGSLLIENKPACHLVWSGSSLTFSEDRLSDTVNILVFSLPTHPEKLESEMNLLSRIRERHPKLKIIVLIEDCIVYLIASINALRVNAIFSLKASLQEWRELINLTLKGKYSYSKNVVEAMYRAPDFNSLKYNEFAVLNYIAQGVSIMDVANLMSREVKTIKGSRLAAMRKLGMNHYAELISIKNILRGEKYMLSMKAH